MISLIAAVARNGVIGSGNDIPWRLRSDFEHFKAYTLGKTVIMGRLTWDSLPTRPLRGRINMVVSRHLDPLSITPALVYRTLENALEACSTEDEAVVIGGGQLYRHALETDLVNRIVLSEIDCHVDGDVFFPAFDRELFQITSRIPIRDDTMPYDIVTYEKSM